MERRAHGCLRIHSPQYPTTLANAEWLRCLPLVQQAASALNVGVTTLKKVGGLGPVRSWV